MSHYAKGARQPGDGLRGEPGANTTPLPVMGRLRALKEGPNPTRLGPHTEICSRTLTTKTGY